MTIQNTSRQMNKSVMGFCYYSYFKACYFAGLFRRASTQILSDT